MTDEDMPLFSTCKYLHLASADLSDKGFFSVNKRQDVASR